MAVALKLSVDQVATAITLLDSQEKKQLRQRLTELLSPDMSDSDGLAWTSLAESSLEFWLDPEEDIYSDLAPASTQNGA